MSVTVICPESITKSILNTDSPSPKFLLDFGCLDHREILVADQNRANRSKTDSSARGSTTRPLMQSATLDVPFFALQSASTRNVDLAHGWWRPHRIAGVPHRRDDRSTVDRLHKRLI